MNRSMDFLEMIKNNPEKKSESGGRFSLTHQNEGVRSVPAAQNESLRTVPLTHFAVIDTETNWDNEVMSIGIALADCRNFKCVEARYYVIDPEYRIGGMYSNVLNAAKNIPANVMTREDALSDMIRWFKAKKITKLYAYNAKFDKGHLSELSDFEWFDIMRLAAYKQYNSCIPESAELCKTGRLKRGYAVEDILRMLSGDFSYREVHNAVMDAIDELKIMELLGHDLKIYDIGKL